MLVNRPFDVAVKTPNLKASHRFNVDVLGMGLARRAEHAGDAAPEPGVSTTSGRKPAERFFDTGAYRQFYGWQSCG
jgi:hypothetical protein